MKNKIVIISLFVLSLIWIIGCTEEKNPVTTGEIPTISKVNIQDRWSTQSSGDFKTEVWVNDPQGIGNLTGVFLTVHESSGGEAIFTDSLFDDGAYYYPQAGDVLAGDGVFSNKFRTSDITENEDPAEYIFRFVAIDKQNHESQIWESLIGFGPNSPPEIHQISAPDSISYESDSTIISITVSDDDGLEDIVQAYFESENLANSVILYEKELYNDGDFENHGDLLAGDDIYSTKISPEFLAGKKGDYNLIFHLKDINEEENINRAAHSIYLENFASQLVNIIMPDTILIPTNPGQLNRKLITVEVSDSESLADIDSVYFFSKKPDSTFALSGQPFIMVDNGLPYNPGGNLWVETGDEVAGDGIYSLSIFADYTSTSGVYTFSFYIRDKVGNLTGPVKKTLLLTQ